MIGRRWIQIHLLTAIMLMLASGALLWVNVRWQGMHDLEFRTELGILTAYTDSQGWPLPYHIHSQAPGITYGQPWSIRNFAIDAALALSVLAVITVASEWWLRRQERHCRTNSGNKLPRLHFSTMIILTLCIGALAGLNVQPTRIHETTSELTRKGTLESIQRDCYGWPLSFCQFSDNGTAYPNWSWRCLIGDLVIWAGSSILIVIIMEKWERRRDRQAANSKEP
jgi:hypothetical protein